MPLTLKPICWCLCYLFYTAAINDKFSSPYWKWNFLYPGYSFKGGFIIPTPIQSKRCAGLHEQHALGVNLLFSTGKKAFIITSHFVYAPVFSYFI